jgi:polar amino acid transport system substrate-binding protein
MKRLFPRITRITLCILAALWAVVLPAPGSPTAQEVLRMAYPAFLPFHGRDSAGNMTGFFHEIMTEALERRMGLAVTWSEYPWPRCQNYVATGRADAMITVPTPERLTYSLTHPTPFYEKQLMIFTGADHPRLGDILAVRTLADIRQKGFSVITYIGNGWSRNNVESLDIPVKESPTLEGIWPMLAARRGDIVIEWPMGAWPDIRKTHLENRIVQVHTVLDAMPFHLLVGKDSRFSGILEDFEQAIAAMKEDGTMEKILSPYSEPVR